MWNSDVTYDQIWWPILRIRALHLPIQSAHIQQWTHTHCEHTPGAVGSHLCCGAQGALGESVPCSRDLSRGIEGEESAEHSTPTPTQFLLTPDSDSQPLDYESNSLTIRPRLWLKYECIVEILKKQNLNSTECIQIMHFMKVEKHLEICEQIDSLDRQTDRQIDMQV